MTAPRPGHPARAAGARDVRPHRRRLRPHELGDDRRHAPPLARARRGPGPGRARLRARSTWPPAPATSPIELAGAGRRGHRARLLRADAGAGPRQGARHRLGAGQRARAALRRRRVRRGHGRLRRAQLLRPRPRPRRDGARDAARRARGDPRDHHAAAAAAVVVLPALVRPRSCRRSAAWPATRTPTPTCPRACGASRARASWPRAWPPPGLEDVRWMLTAGGIIAIHAGTAS